MGWINGNGKRAEVTALTVTPAGEPEKQALVVSDKSNNSAELARFMPVMDIQQAIQRRDIIVRAMRELMVDGVDYGKIPNCGDKPALLQPGADKLANLFGLTLQYNFLEKVEDWSGAAHGGEPFFYYQIGAKVYRGDFLLAEGVGACHSWESKYRWRKMERTCPQCGKENIRHSRDGGWYCWRKTEGCGATFDDGDPAIEGQQVGRKPNPDVLDSVNTILKIAFKRCKIHGTINGTSASEFFTQDIEDFSVSEEPDLGGRAPNTRAAAQFVAEEKIAQRQPLVRPAPWKSMAEVARSFEQVRERAGEVVYREQLERYGWRNFQEMRSALDSRDTASRNSAKAKATELYFTLDELARKEGK